ncbi:DUF4350 domain-containing protein [Porphyrobacter sp. ULC335]|uniref:DUF4350 domain-containing protein n=1 Tax=Porphyrobacter sp. ULC335 TaxID=2854260 RepID=UPI002220EA7C|nr:DUF4350 domain-containing protein [Porphyrobacter sp. ULC335]UYV16868.1 DUF4350 domain-containing protein [Porphyrobacter sp. ULC335]
MKGGGAFSKAGVFALVAGGFALFLAALYLIGAGEEFADQRGNGQAHAAATGLNGYVGLVRLAEAKDYSVDRSRSPEGLETDGLLIIAPTPNTEAEAIAEILEKRAYLGPTLVIMPKWSAIPPPPLLPSEARDKFKPGWVMLGPANPSDWPEELPGQYSFKHKVFPETKITVPDVAMGVGPAKPAKPTPPGRWSGMGQAGALPASPTLYAEPIAPHDALITDSAGRVLAYTVVPYANGEPDEEAYPVMFIAEPDLVNNYGLADPARAAAAIALVDELTYDGEIDYITFDMTLNGFGAAENLLTLAFRPPFLAATLSLLVALLIVGWRAFMRFGPAASPAGPDIAFGKRQLIANGAGLIIRARRFRLLAKPYAALSARRLAERLGLSRAEPEAIDDALARRLPMEEPFTRRAARMEAATKPADILAAAQSLDDLNAKLQQGQTTR